MRTLSHRKNLAAFSQETSMETQGSGLISFAFKLVSSREAYASQILSIQTL